MGSPVPSALYYLWPIVFSVTAHVAFHLMAELGAQSVSNWGKQLKNVHRWRDLVCGLGWRGVRRRCLSAGKKRIGVTFAASEYPQTGHKIETAGAGLLG